MGIPNIPHGMPIPRKIWCQATDILVDYRRAGNTWVEMGRPYNGPLYDQFCTLEKEYNIMADNIWFAKWTKDQREEWDRIHKNTEIKMSYKGPTESSNKQF